MEFFQTWLIYSLITIGVITLLTRGIAYIFKVSSPYKDDTWKKEHNQRILEKYREEILHYEVLIRMRQNALRELSTDMDHNDLEKDLEKLIIQKEKYLKKIGYFF